MKLLLSLGFLSFLFWGSAVHAQGASVYFDINNSITSKVEVDISSQDPVVVKWEAPADTYRNCLGSGFSEWSGSKDLKGVQNFFLWQSSNFTLSCVRLDGKVDVVKRNVYIIKNVGSTSNIALFKFFATPMTANSDGTTEVELSWDVYRADECKSFSLPNDPAWPQGGVLPNNGVKKIFPKKQETRNLKSGEKDTRVPLSSRLMRRKAVYGTDYVTYYVDCYLKKNLTFKDARIEFNKVAPKVVPTKVELKIEEFKLVGEKLSWRSNYERCELLFADQNIDGTFNESKAQKDYPGTHEVEVPKKEAGQYNLRCRKKDEKGMEGKDGPHYKKPLVDFWFTDEFGNKMLGLGGLNTKSAPITFGWEIRNAEKCTFLVKNGDQSVYTQDIAPTRGTLQYLATQKSKVFLKCLAGDRATEKRVWYGDVFFFAPLSIDKFEYKNGAVHWSARADLCFVNANGEKRSTEYRDAMGVVAGSLAESSQEFSIACFRQGNQEVINKHLDRIKPSITFERISPQGKIPAGQSVEFKLKTIGIEKCMMRIAALTQSATFETFVPTVPVDVNALFKIEPSSTRKYIFDCIVTEGESMSGEHLLEVDGAVMPKINVFTLEKKQDQHTVTLAHTGDECSFKIRKDNGEWDFKLGEWKNGKGEEKVWTITHPGIVDVHAICRLILDRQKYAVEKFASSRPISELYTLDNGIYSKTRHIEKTKNGYALSGPGVVLIEPIVKDPFGIGHGDTCSIKDPYTLLYDYDKNKKIVSQRWSSDGADLIRKKGEPSEMTIDRPRQITLDCNYNDFHIERKLIFAPGRSKDGAIPYFLRTEGRNLGYGDAFELVWSVEKDGKKDTKSECRIARALSPESFSVGKARSIKLLALHGNETIHLTCFVDDQSISQLLSFSVAQHQVLDSSAPVLAMTQEKSPIKYGDPLIVQTLVTSGMDNDDVTCQIRTGTDAVIVRKVKFRATNGQPMRYQIGSVPAVQYPERLVLICEFTYGGESTVRRVSQDLYPTVKPPKFSVKVIPGKIDDKERNLPIAFAITGFIPDEHRISVIGSRCGHDLSYKEEGVLYKRNYISRFIPYVSGDCKLVIKKNEAVLFTYRVSNQKGLLYDFQTSDLDHNEPGFSQFISFTTQEDAKMTITGKTREDYECNGYKRDMLYEDDGFAEGFAPNIYRFRPQKTATCILESSGTKREFRLVVNEAKNAVSGSEQSETAVFLEEHSDAVCNGLNDISKMLNPSWRFTDRQCSLMKTNAKDIEKAFQDSNSKEAIKRLCPILEVNKDMCGLLMSQTFEEIVSALNKLYPRIPKNVPQGAIYTPPVQQPAVKMPTYQVPTAQSIVKQNDLSQGLMKNQSFGGGFLNFFSGLKFW